MFSPVTGPGPVFGSQRQPCLLAAVAGQTEECACAKLKVWVVIRRQNHSVRLKTRQKTSLATGTLFRQNKKANKTKQSWCFSIFYYFYIKSEKCDRNDNYSSQWPKRTCSQSECTKAWGHFPLPSDPAQLQQVHLPRDRHSATSDKIKSNLKELSYILLYFLNWAMKLVPAMQRK